MIDEKFNTLSEIILKRSADKNLYPAFVINDKEKDAILVGFDFEDAISEKLFLKIERLFHTYPVELVRIKQRDEYEIIGTFKTGLLSNKPL